MRVQRADPVRGDGQIPARQFRGGGAGEGRDQDRVGTIPIRRAPDLAREVGRLARPGGPKMRYSDVTLWSLWPISSSVPVACSLGIGFLLARRVLSGIKLIHRQHPPALLLELRAADPDALAAKRPEHRGERLDGEVLERGFVDVHLQVAGADGDFAVKQDGFALVLDLLAFERVDEAGLREVVRHVHPRRALPLDLFAALLDDAGVQHGLRQLLPNLGLELADQLPDRSGNGEPHGAPAR